MDKQNFSLILSLCEQIIKDANKQTEINARAIANAIAGITDEVWKEILFAGESYDRDDARRVCLSFLASIFPWCYSMPSDTASTDSEKQPTINITRASIDDIEPAALLFDQYRQFYKQDSDINLAKNYIMNRISTETSTIFLAKVDNRAIGFTQLYSSYCSVDASPIIILYDLFVDSASRQSGVGKALLDRAKDYAKQIGADKSHLRINAKTTAGSLAGIGFGMGEFFKNIKDYQEFDICYSINENEWNGRKSLQLMIRDLQTKI